MAINQKEKDEKFIQYWENCIKLGRLPYSLINGVLAGIGFFILTNLAYYLFTDETLLHLDMNGFLSAFICYLVGIFFFYVPIWNVNSFKYHVILKKKTGKKKNKKFPKF